MIMSMCVLKEENEMCYNVLFCDCSNIGQISPLKTEQCLQISYNYPATLVEILII